MGEAIGKRRKPGARINWTEEMNAQLRDLWGDRTLSKSQVAKALGASTRAIEYQAGVLRLGARPELQRKWSPERIAAFKRLWQDPALTNAEVAEKLGIPKRHAGSLAAMWKFGPRPIGRSLVPPYTAEEDDLIRQLWPDKNVSIPAMAKRLGRTIGSVRWRAYSVLKLPQRRHVARADKPASEAKATTLKNQKPRLRIAGQPQQRPEPQCEPTPPEIRPIDAIDKALIKHGATYAGRARIAEAHKISATEIQRRWHRVAGLMRQGVA